VIALITAGAALVLVICLLRMAIRRRRSTESAYAGSHRRAASQPPNPTLRRAIATAGTHGLGMIRKSPSR
jgi:hypothetical protein